MARDGDSAAAKSRERGRALLVMAGVIGIAIFAADLMSPLQGALAVLYIIVVLLVARAGGRREVLAAGLGCAVFALIAFGIDHLGDPIDAAFVRLGVSLIAIAATTLLTVEQLRAEAERRRSEQRYCTIFDLAGFAIWETDWSATRRHLLAVAPEGADLRAWFAEHPEEIHMAMSKAVIGDVNRAATALFGASRADLVGRGTIADYAPGTELVFADALASLFEGTELVEKDARYVRPDGRTVDVVLRMRVLAEGESWSRVLVMALDVTERNEARARVEQASAELAHAARVSTLGQLTASIAHEVNQPLAAIINYGKSGKRWLAREMPDIGEVSNCLDHIVANGNRAADVVARVRAHARKAAPEAGPLDLAALVEEAIDLVAREARAAEVSLQVVKESTVPLVIGDRIQIQQVLVNLLMNAIQAMREIVGRPRELCIRLEEESGAVRIAVADCGAGIVGDPMRIFDPFFTTKSDGMGIGLSICRSIIEAQGGRITAANNPLHGATIAFTLPIADAAAPLPGAPIDTSV